MTWTRAYGDFASAYGTGMLVLLTLPAVTQPHIDAGPPDQAPRRL